MDMNRNGSVPIPEDLHAVIHQGVAQGRQVLARRKRARRAAASSLCSVALAFGLFVGGVRLSPAFAAAVEDLPVLGQLVQVFGVNQEVAQGGSQAQVDSAALTMERSGDTELIRLNFHQTQAAAYRAEFASYPKTVTITLPGTKGVEILSQISRAADTSQYIKSVYQLPTSTQDTAVLQLELESDADVQIQEYRDPGSLVIQLTPAEIQLDTVYSLRTLSLDQQGLQQAADQYAQQSPRLLRDDQGTYFLELGQYASQEEAQAALQALDGDLIVETRTGNNVPVAFSTMEDYQSSRFLNEYYQVLLNSTTAEPVLDFLDQHFADASVQEREEMLRGLTGFLEDYHEDMDWEKAASFYRMADEPLPEFFDQTTTR